MCDAVKLLNSIQDFGQLMQDASTNSLVIESEEATILLSQVGHVISKFSFETFL